MNRLLMLAVLILRATGARAEWAKVAESQSSIIYLDFGTMRKSGNLIKVWELYDNKTIQTWANVNYMSGKAQMQYDCQEEQTRELAGMLYSQNMGQGDVVWVFSNDPRNWFPVVPGSISEKTFNAVCSQK